MNILSIIELPMDLATAARILASVADTEIREGRGRVTTDHLAIEIHPAWGRCLVTYDEPLDAAPAPVPRRPLAAVPDPPPGPSCPTPLDLARRLRRPPQGAGT